MQPEGQREDGVSGQSTVSASQEESGNHLANKPEAGNHNQVSAQQQGPEVREPIQAAAPTTVAAQVVALAEHTYNKQQQSVSSTQQQRTAQPL